MSNPRWTATTTASDVRITPRMLEKMFQAIASAKHEIPRRIMSAARYRKCMSGNHEFIYGCCVHCFAIEDER